MEKQKVEISKIVIKIGEKEATLTLEEVKALRDVLDNLLGNKNTITYILYSVPYVNPNPYWTVTYTSKIADGITYVNCNSSSNKVDYSEVVRAMKNQAGIR